MRNGLGALRGCDGSIHGYDRGVSEAWYASSIVCPDCGGPLEWGETRITSDCGFATGATAPLDFRPRRARTSHLDLPSVSPEEKALELLPTDRPVLTYEGPRASRDSVEIFSAAQPYLRPGDTLLDLGCGPRDQATPAEWLGLRYVGIDFGSPNADLLADAHSIPFAAGTFDAVLTYAVVEHLSNPFVAVAEIARVLRPGGIFFGAVSQGEPYHHSYFHPTPLGVLSLFQSAGLTTLRLWPSYDTLHSLAVMGRYARVTRAMIETVHRIDRAFPFLAPRQYFGATGKQKQLEALYRAGSLCFVARRP